MRIDVLFLILLLTACDPKVPTWQEKCTKSHQEMMMIPMYIGDMMTMQPQWYDECDLTEWVCFIPKDWKYEKNCGERK